VPHPGIVQALFGVAIWLYVVARFYQRLHRSPPMLPSDLYAFSRRLSRVVYALLYTLMLVRLAIGIWRAAPDHPLQIPFDDFQGYLAWGVLAIVTIHALSAACRHFFMNSAAMPAPAKAPANAGAIQPNG
jgi:cytochrome b561